MTDPCDWRHPAPSGPYAEVIGDPIAQSKSPAIHTFWLNRLGIDATYRAAHVRPDELADYITARRGDPLWRGCNVTMPHKAAIIPYVDRLDVFPYTMEAVNSVIPMADGRLLGMNTDVPGFREALAGQGFGRALVIGAGGAAWAVLVSLAAHGVKDIWVQNRDVARAEALLARLGLAPQAMGLGAFPGSMESPDDSGVPAVNLMVNASALGMVGHPALTFDLNQMAADGTVYDIVTAPLETPLLAAARARGLRCIDGLAMLIGQAAVAFEHFFAVKPPREPGDAALRAILMA